MVNYVHFSYLSFLFEIDIRNYIIVVYKEIPHSFVPVATHIGWGHQAPKDGCLDPSRALLFLSVVTRSLAHASFLTFGWFAFGIDTGKEKSW